MCPDGHRGSHKRVGGFSATAGESQRPSTRSGAGPPQISGAAVDEVMAALDAQSSLAPRDAAEASADSLARYKVGNLPDAYYIPNWLDAEQEAVLARAVEAPNSWETMRTRSTQEWGAGDRCACGRGLRREPLHPPFASLADALHEWRIFDGALYPMNSIRVNKYMPGQGIFPHCDGAVYYPRVAIASFCLQASCRSIHELETKTV